MDIGREYTERWHHHMQIRDAVGADLLLGSTWMEPLLDLSMRALAPGYAGRDAPVHPSVVVAVTGQTSGAWSLVRESAAWTVYRGSASAPAARITVDADAIWRMLYNAYASDEARRRAQRRGRSETHRAVLRCQVGDGVSRRRERRPARVSSVFARFRGRRRWNDHGPQSISRPVARW
jgi:hypothetical protein